MVEHRFEEIGPNVVNLDKQTHSSLYKNKMVIGNIDKNIHVTPKKVNLNSLASVCFIFCPSMQLDNKVCNFLVLNMNGLLCETSHLKYVQNKQKPIVLAMRCGNKFVSVLPNCCKFLELCSSRFDIAIWSITYQKTLQPIVPFLLGEKSVHLVFVWGARKCLETNIPHPKNPHI
jgi:hypothetical protein